ARRRRASGRHDHGDGRGRSRGQDRDRALTVARADCRTRRRSSAQNPLPGASPEDSMTLTGKAALVAGATRGAGRGIAIELGAAGATVYATGRTSRERQSDYGRTSETIEQTAELVTAAGGNGIAIRVDHLVCVLSSS